MKKQAWLTAYDAPTAELLEEAGIDAILVGDSVGMVVLGYSTTTPVTMEEMLHHIRAVRRGAKKTRIIGDLPLKGVERGPKQALQSAKRFIEAGCDSVKLEWREDFFEILDLLKAHRIPVMGHFGLTPQSVKKGERFGLRDATAKEAAQLVRRALEAEKRGASSVLLECVPWKAAKEVAEKLRIPVIGIGAGPYCDGQVLVFHDLVGIFRKFKPKFVKRYARLHPLMERAVKRYQKEVSAGKFPAKRHSFEMKTEAGK